MLELLLVKRCWLYQGSCQFLFCIADVWSRVCHPLYSLPAALLYALCSSVVSGCSTSVDVVFVPGAGDSLQLSMPASFNSSVVYVVARLIS